MKPIWFQRRVVAGVINALALSLGGVGPIDCHSGRRRGDVLVVVVLEGCLLRHISWLAKAEGFNREALQDYWLWEKPSMEDVGVCITSNTRCAEGAGSQYLLRTSSQEPPSPGPQPSTIVPVSVGLY